MLNLRFNACHASSGSPEKERRLLRQRLSENEENREQNGETETEAESMNRRVRSTIGFTRQGTSERLRALLQEKVLTESPDALHRKDEDEGVKFFYNWKEDFYRRAIVARLLRTANYLPEDFSLGEDIMTNYSHMPTDELEDIAKKYNVSIDREALPAAFSFWNRLYFDAGHPDFKEPIKRERMMMHELTHSVLNKKRSTGGMPYRNIDRATALIKQVPAWPELKRVVAEYMRQHPEHNLSTADAEYAHEIFAIYLAGRKHAFTDERDVCKKISELMDSATNDNSLLKEFISRLEGEIQEEYEVVQKNGTEAADEAKGNQLLLEREEQRAREERAAGSLRYNIDEDSPLTEQANMTAEKDDHKKPKGLSPESIKASQQSIKDLQSMFNTLRGKLSGLRGNLYNFANIDDPSRRRSEILTALQYLDRNGSELIILRSYLEILEKIEQREIPQTDIEYWEKRMKIQGLDIREKRQIVFNEVNKEIATINAVTVDIQDYIQSVGSTVDHNEDRPENQKVIHFYSLVEMWGGLNEIKDAVYNAWDADRKRRRHRFAKEFSPVLEPLPYGMSVVQTLSKQARASNDEETNKYMDYLKSEGFTYDELLGNEYSLMTQNRSSINRQKAIVEYAADHGWLFRLNRKNGHNVYGLDFAGHFGTQSFLELIDRNEKGKKSEIERGEQRAKYLPEISLIIDEMRDELSKKNVYAVRGMLQIIQNKGKIGEANTWGLTTVMRALKDDQKLLAIIDPGLLDNIGGIGIEQSAWSLTFFKTQRNQILAWKQRKGEGFTDDKTFVLASTLKKIEDKMPASMKGSSITDKAHLDHAIAKVLAGQTFRDHKSGVIISIFHTDFNEYREYLIKHATSTQPSKTDDDYFNPENDGSDVLLLPSSSIAAILSRTSQGYWTLGTKAPNFMATVILRDIDLEANKDLQNKYRAEMSSKLQFWVNEVYTQDAACNKFTSDVTLDYAHKPGISNMNILDELNARKIISDEDYIRIIDKSKGKLSEKQHPIKEELERKKKEKEKKKNEEQKSEEEKAKATVEETKKE